MSDPLSDFLRGTPKPANAIPVQYRISEPTPAQDSAGFFGMFDQLKKSANPEGLFRMFAARNPKLQQVMKLVEESGGDPKATFYAKCKEMNVDPESILSKLR